MLFRYELQHLNMLRSIFTILMEKSGTHSHKKHWFENITPWFYEERVER